MLHKSLGRSDKELSEHELAALRAVEHALGNATVTPVYLSFVRKFRRTREVNSDWLLSCTVRFTFGFRCTSTDEGGIGDAMVKLRRIPAADGARLAHNYFVWMPEAVFLTITEGQECVMPLSRSVIVQKLGNSEHRWVANVTNE